MSCGAGRPIVLVLFRGLVRRRVKVVGAALSVGLAGRAAPEPRRLVA
jgi:hypothetical protein